jgi:hypothetical protein
MLINVQCRQYRLVFDSEVGQITMSPEAQRPQFEHPIGCPHCGPRSMDQVWLTEVGQTQLTAAVLTP